MPFIRSARDRRGYETLYVMHAFETGRDGRARPQVLYACRSVPYARVGRPAIDESVQRRIETAYPGLSFDWPRLLKEAAASAPRPDKGEERRNRKKGRQAAQSAQPKRSRPEQKPAREPAPARTADPARPAEASEPAHPAEPAEPAESAERAEPASEPFEPLEPLEPLEPAEIGPLRVDASWPVVGLIGQMPALVLRGRYIEIATRIQSRIEDAGERRRLLAEAARLNPETWTTENAAREGVARFDAAFEALASRLRQTPAV